MQYKFWTLLAVGALSACTNTVSNDVRRDGTVGGELNFPDPEDATLEGGSFPNVDDLLGIDKGMSRKALYQLIGRPHFSERIFAHEWDYLFNFRQPDGSVKVCQYKVVFDKDKLAQSFFYKPADCQPTVAKAAPAPATAIIAPVPVPVVQKAAKVAPLPKDINIYFPFAKGSTVMLLPEERAKLIAAVREYRLHHDDSPMLLLVGYTDRIGSSAYNMQLAKQRAKAIKAYLISLGLDGELIDYQYRGKANPVVACDDTDFNKLTACLAPNRRVSVSFLD